MHTTTVETNPNHRLGRYNFAFGDGLSGYVEFDRAMDAAVVRLNGPGEFPPVAAKLPYFSACTATSFEYNHVMYKIRFEKVTPEVKSGDVPFKEAVTGVRLDVSDPNSVFGQAEFKIGDGLVGDVYYNVKANRMSIRVSNRVSSLVASSGDLVLSEANSFSFPYRGANHVVYLYRVTNVKPTVEQRLAAIEKQLADLAKQVQTNTRGLRKAARSFADDYYEMPF